ncbi:hypothetical protein AMECASPLE_030267, partial [Ameca splendens]
CRLSSGGERETGVRNLHQTECPGWEDASPHNPSYQEFGASSLSLQSLLSHLLRIQKKLNPLI